MNTRDVVAGSLLAGLGAGAMLTSQIELDTGTMRFMGPGYFPVLVSGLLIAFSLVIVVNGLTRGKDDTQPMPRRGRLLLVPLAPVVFALTVRGLGLVPSILLTVFLASFASPRMTFRFAILLSLGLTVLCTAIFSFGIDLPIPLLGSWPTFLVR
jgi:hypothetical protein